MSTLHSRIAACLLAGIGVLFSTSPASAAAVYTSSARSTFTLIAPPGFTVTDHLPSTSTVATGTATAAVTKHLRSADGIHPATVDAGVTGSATYPPDSSSMAAVQSGHHFIVPRVDADGPLPTVEIDFIYEIFWETDLSITRPGFEFASGGAYFALSGFRDGITELTLDAGFPGSIVTGTFPDGSDGWEFNPKYVEFDGSPVHESHSLTITGTITVFSGRFGAFSVITDAAGSAVSIPEPSTAWLLIAALPLFWRARRSAGAVRNR
ncbi:PEP-CTERM sorting domain-containing protein [Pseudaquabacterium terrae]|uniref:PEP-CTERM sorting domain-containing protein n=1 Tax=Pseudaquabacterium terrae TaxID=2732868 RepID=UPI0015662DED|nr:PEP-CTERM sorting domain-containing protein [Aquabacterium terrae]